MNLMMQPISALSIISILPILVQCQPDFTALIYDKFGFNTSQTRFLGRDNLTELFQRVLSGHKYNTHANVCIHENCTSDAVSIVHTQYSML